MASVCLFLGQNDRSATSRLQWFSSLKFHSSAKLPPMRFNSPLGLGSIAYASRLRRSFGLVICIPRLILKLTAVESPAEALYVTQAT